MVLIMVILARPRTYTTTDAPPERCLLPLSGNLRNLYHPGVREDQGSRYASSDKAYNGALAQSDTAHLQSDLDIA